MRYLIVGDVHAVPSEIDECNKLANYIYNTSKIHNVETILFTGDIYNYHNIVHLPVIQFWKETFIKLKEKFRIIVIQGNHDIANSKNHNSYGSLHIHEDQVEVVSSPRFDENNNILYMPYYHDNKVFIEHSNRYGEVSILFCHQTFDGSKYENGFYAKDGVNPNELKAKYIISGHIHSPQEFSKIWYVGAPRWRTINDANQKRHLWVVDIENGVIKNKIGIDTSEVCREMLIYKDTENEPINLVIKPNKNIIIDIHGSHEYIFKRRKQLSNLKEVKIRTFPENQIIKIKESDGLVAAFNKFADEFQCKNGSNKQVILDVLKEKLSWMK